MIPISPSMITGTHGLGSIKNRIKIILCINILKKSSTRVLLSNSELMMIEIPIIANDRMLNVVDTVCNLNTMVK